MGLAVLLVACLAGCGWSRSDRNDAPSSTSSTLGPEHLCDLIVIPFEAMREDGSTWLEVVDDRSGQGGGRGISAMVGFALAARGSDQAGRFEPVLTYLAKRSAAEMDGSSDPSPKLTAAVRANARALDRFLADGGCG